jgi:hypothetical protein
VAARDNRRARREESRSAARRYQMNANIAETRRLRNLSARTKEAARIRAENKRASVLSRAPTGRDTRNRTMGRGTPSRPRANAGLVENIRGREPDSPTHATMAELEAELELLDELNGN